MNRVETAVVSCVFAWLSLFGAGGAQAADTDLGAIYPLGDSITYGYPGIYAGYRGLLYETLTKKGYTFRFIGDQAVNSGTKLLPADQQHHAGHASYTTWDINKNLNGHDAATYNRYHGEERNPHGGYWITGGHGTGRAAISPNYVLLLIGTNDVNQGAGTTAANLHELLANLTSLLPNANILVGEIPPIHNTDYVHCRTLAEAASTVGVWNQMVRNEVADWQKSGKHVTCVDLNTNFPVDGLSGDGVHPNDAGYNWMAEQWANAILAQRVVSSGVLAPDGLSAE